MNLPAIVLDDLARLSQTPQDLLRLMTEADEIRWKVLNKREEMKQTEEEYFKAKQTLEQEMRHIQGRCKHNSTRYHGDPAAGGPSSDRTLGRAGGSDSHTECLICGAWFRGKNTTSGEER